MTLVSHHRFARRRLRTLGIAALMTAMAGSSFTACSVVKAVEKAKDAVEGNKAVIGAFTQKVQSGESQSFEAIYQTTGTSPATIVYAVGKSKDLLFRDTPSRSGTATFDIVVNSSGEFFCTPHSTGTPGWTCEKLQPGTATQENAILDVYTPSHWVTFLDDFSLAAGFAGDKVRSSDMTVNGFLMHCVDLQAPGVPGTSTICTTSQGILGYVKVATESTSFGIKTYIASPAASLFQLPPGAKIQTVTVPSTTG